MASYLVTGGAGFIGSHIARHLALEGHQVIVFDNFSTGDGNLLPPEIEVIEGDLRNYNDLTRLPKVKFSAVLHLAAQSSGEISHAEPDYDLDTNARGTLNILRWSFDAKIERFVNASSMGVYGEIDAERCPVAEDDPTKPLSFYGVSKLAGEGYCNYFMSKGMAITSYRMFNVFGPGQNLDNLRQGMVSIYLTFLLQNQPLYIKGSLNRFRDFIYVEDVVSAWINCINCKKTFNKVYNLATGQKTFVYELVNRLLATFAKPADYPMISDDSTPGDQSGIFANISKLSNDLGWRPKFMLQDGLDKLCAYYQTRML